MPDKIVRIHSRAQPTRPHFIADWAEKRGLRQADIATEIGADKSVVSRWFRGTTPADHWQHKLAALFECEVEGLFRNPDEDWIYRFLQGRNRDEIERIKATIEAAFPRAKKGS